MTNLRNTLFLGAACVSLALSSAAFAQADAQTSDTVAIAQDTPVDAGATKAEHKKNHKKHKSHKAKKGHKKHKRHKAKKAHKAHVAQ